MSKPLDERISIENRTKNSSRGSHPIARKSRSISRYLLGTKRSSIDITPQDVDISRCLTSIGIFDSSDLWTNVTLFRDYTTCRRLFIITDKNQLIIGKSNAKQSLFKIKHRLDLNRTWLYTNLSDSTVSEITSLNFYDYQRAFILGWPVAENFLVEFDTKDLRDAWQERIQSSLGFSWHLNSSNIEHVRVVIDQNQESDSNNTTGSSSFLIRKVISIQPQETVRDLIKKCIDTSHLRDSSIENYVLYVLNDSTVPTLPFTPTQLIPLIGHEYPYAIKMKHLKNSNHLSFDGDDHLSLQSTPSTNYSHHHSSTTSLNNISIQTHDFELRKRDNDVQNKKHRFFHKRKTKDPSSKPPTHSQQAADDYQAAMKVKVSYQFIGQTLEELIKKANYQLPPILQQLLEILYCKGPDTTGIFRKVANTRLVKDCIDKIERNIALQEEELHPILAAGIFKHFLRSLPEPVFNSIEYDQWKKCLRLPTLQEKISFARRSILGTLSQANHLLLKAFICVLNRISQNADTNGMNSFNLGLCVSNSLFKTESTTISSGKQEADVMSSIVEFLIINCSSIFGSDVVTCIPDKHIIVHQIPSLTRPTASSIESLDEVESSPHLPVVNRSRDSGLATSDQPFNDDSSEISEHVRRHIPVVSPPSPSWTSSIAYGNGAVITSIILPTVISSITRGRNSKMIYKPSKQFMEREKLTNDTTDDSDHDGFNATAGDSSMRSSTTTVQNMTIGKIKRSKPILRHSSLGTNEHHHQQQDPQYPIVETKHVSKSDVKRASSLKQFHRPSDEDDEEQNRTLNASSHSQNTSKKKTTTAITEQILPSTMVTNSKPSTHERRSRLVKSKQQRSEEESMTTSLNHLEPQDLDLTSEPLSTINQRLSNSSTTRSASFTLNTVTKRLDSPLITHSIPTQEPIIVDHRSRQKGPLIATTNQILPSSRLDHTRESTTNLPIKAERDRTFVHHCDSRAFKLGIAIQMKPMEEIFLPNHRRRPCHRQNALRYKSVDQDPTERRSRQSTPVLVNQNRVYSSETPSATSVTRCQSIERRFTPSPQPIKAFSFDINDELHPSDISWSVREKAKLFEHTNPKKFSTGRENYV